MADSPPHTPLLMPTSTTYVTDELCYLPCIAKTLPQSGFQIGTAGGHQETVTVYLRVNRSLAGPPFNSAGRQEMTSIQLYRIHDTTVKWASFSLKFSPWDHTGISASIRESLCTQWLLLREGMCNNPTRLEDINSQILESQYNTADLSLAQAACLLRGGQKLLHVQLHCLQHPASQVTETRRKHVETHPRLPSALQPGRGVRPSSHSLLARAGHTLLATGLGRVICTPRRRENQILGALTE